MIESEKIWLWYLSWLGEVYKLGKDKKYGFEMWDKIDSKSST